MYCIFNENVQLARTYLPRALSLIQDRKDVFLLTRIALPRLVMRLLHRWKIDCFIVLLIIDLISDDNKK